MPSEGNQELKKVSVVDTKKGVQIIPEVKGATFTVSGACELLGIKGGKEGEIKLGKGAVHIEEGVEAI